jgi:cobalt-precorrin 5A hydrolase
MKTLTVGIGCRRLTSAQQIEAAVRVALAGRPFDHIREVATIESKADEPGLVEFCTRHALALRTFTHEQIAGFGVVPTPSSAVRALAGVDGVCEPCALLACPDSILIVPKTIVDGVTVAIASLTASSRSTTELQQQDTP